MHHRSPTALDWLLLLSLAAIWGVSFLFIKRSIAVYTPFQMATWRMVLALLVYLPIGWLYWPRIDWKRWRALLVVAFCGSAIPNFLFALAQTRVSSSLAGVLNSLTPLFTLLIGVFFFQFRPSSSKVIGVLLGFAGATALVLFQRGRIAGGEVEYALLCVFATLCYAINANTVGRYLSDQHPAAIAAGAFMLTGGLFLIGLGWSGAWSVTSSRPDGVIGLGYISYLAVMGTVGGSILYFWLLQRTSALFATSVTYLLPVTALIVGALDGEEIEMVDLISTAIILIGVYLARK
ncbi:MAG: EamA family transporter [Saprospiraceae bacterium]|nr:EamA family transporter [Saprospiraceae bacterium]MDW8483986.1 EamA family transporter [Saprospiraceae bacterium]